MSDPLLRLVVRALGVALLLGVARPIQSAPAESRPAAEWAYELKRAGEVSAAVYNADGVLVRTLLRAEPRQPGRHVLRWDGLDRRGEPQPPGDYTIKLLRKPQFKREFVMQVGVNPDSKPYHRWVGDFGGGTSVAVDDSGMYVSSRNAEGNYMLLKQSLDGAERMWARNDPDPWMGGLSLGSDGETVYVLQQNGYILLFDAETGEHTGRWGYLPEDIQSQYKKKRYTDHGPLATIDMDVTADRRVFIDQRRNLVQWLGEDGAATAEVTVDAPRAVAIAPDEGVYVISGARVLKVWRDGRTSMLTDGLSNPWRLDVCPKTNTILVAEGPDDWRVKRFSPVGELIATYGREGGRRAGPYVPEDFKHITDITADGQGGFFIAEPERPPRRVVRVADDGSIVNEWYGGLDFFSWRAVDPLDPTQVWYKPSSGPGLVLAELDYERGTWSVKETYNPGAKAAGLARGGGNKGKYHVRYHDGERYLVGESFPPMIFHHHAGRIDPVVMGNANRKLSVKECRIIAKLKGAADVDQWVEQTFGKKRRDYNTYLWTDRNGDREPQGDEIVLSKLGNVYHGPWNGPSIGRDFAVIVAGGDYNPQRDQPGETRFYSSLLRFAPTGWEDGVPQYELPEEVADIAVAPIHVKPRAEAYVGRAEVHHTYENPQGALYAFYHWGDDSGGGFPTNRSGRYARLTRWTADGKRLWSVGRKATGASVAPIFWNPTAPGHIHYAAEIAGEIRDTIVVCDRIVNPGMAWTKDGLFAGSFFPGRVDDGLPGWVYGWQYGMDATEGPLRTSLINHDSLEGGAITEHNGEVYYLSPGRNMIVVYRVHGYDQDDWARQQTKVQLDEPAPHSEKAGTGLVAEFYHGAEFEGEPVAVVNGVDPNKLTIPDAVDTGRAVAIRMSGLLEAPRSEAYTLTVGGGGVRLWVDGEQVIDAWDANRSRYGNSASHGPIMLRAGRRAPIQIEVYTTATEPKTRLSWHSMNTDPDEVSKALLYPEAPSSPARPQPRDATDPIRAHDFDHRLSADGVLLDNFHYRQRLRGLGRGRHIGFPRVDFGGGVSRVKLGLRGSNAANQLELRLDAPDGRLIADIDIPQRDAGYGTETVLEAEVENVTGVHDLYLVGKGRDTKLRWLRFE